MFGLRHGFERAGQHGAVVGFFRELGQLGVVQGVADVGVFGIEPFGQRDHVSAAVSKQTIAAVCVRARKSLSRSFDSGRGLIL